MNEQEYKMLQKRLTNMLCLNPYLRDINPSRAESYARGLTDAKRMLQNFHHDYPASYFESIKEESN